jgi:hypothetical protein
MPSQEDIEEVDEEIMAQDDADAEAAELQQAAYIPAPGLAPTSIPVSADMTMASHSHLPTHVDMRSLSRDPEASFHPGITAGGDYH